MAALGDGKRIPVSVTINGTRYASTIATMRGEPKIPVSPDIRAAASIAAGDSITVELERDDATRTVDVPAELADALRADPAASVRFATLSHSNQRRHVLSITGADGERLTTQQGTTTIASGTWNGAGQLATYNDATADMTSATYDGLGCASQRRQHPQAGQHPPSSSCGAAGHQTRGS